MYRKWLKKFIISSIMLITLVMVVNFIVDPLQFYRKSSYQPNFSTNQRYQNVGLAKNYDYNAVVVGTSMTENFLPTYLKEKLDFNIIKLSMAGSSIYEQSLITDVAIRTGKVENVIWAIDYFSLRGSVNSVRDDQGPFPYYLYDLNELNNVKYLFNISTLKDTADVILTLLNIKQPNDNLQLLNTWNNNYVFDRDNVIKDYYQKKKEGVVEAEEFTLEKIKNNIDNNVIPIVENNQDINFYFYFPPYSIVFERSLYEEDKQVFENLLASKKYLFEQIGKLKNVKLYDFQYQRDITYNLDLYKDMIHHSIEVNHYIIDQIAQNKSLITEANLEENLKKLENQVYRYQAIN